MYSITCTCNLKYDTDELNYETDSRTKRVVFAKVEGGWGKDGLGVWVSRCKLLYTEWINNKCLLYNTGIFHTLW